MLNTIQVGRIHVVGHFAEVLARGLQAWLDLLGIFIVQHRLDGVDVLRRYLACSQISTGVGFQDKAPDLLRLGLLISFTEIVKVNIDMRMYIEKGFGGLNSFGN
ncbi:hypothetical protein VNO77_14616 [Canavalia gladiata]|uniref:Uncharacterized protein n=1 Tax=Canavalia gladiata TaxID=3824 RepID=A0AAN9QS21_CANGL